MNSRSCHTLCAAIVATFVLGIFQPCGAQESTIPNAKPAKPEAKVSQTQHEIESELLANGLLPNGRIIVQSDHSKLEEKIFDALEVVCGVEFPGNPLEDIVDFLSSQHDIPFLIAEEQLKAVEIKKEIEVQLIISGVTLREALTLLLEPHGLDIVVKNGALIVTSAVAAKAHTEIRVYNVRCLNVTDPETIADVLIYTTGDNSWTQFGGNGNLSYLRGSFVIKQNQSTHRQIETVLNQLKQDMYATSGSYEWPVKDRSRELPGGGQGFF